LNNYKKSFMRHSYIILVLIFIVPGVIQAQGRKTIKNKKIGSQTVYEYFIEEGMKDPVVEKIEKYDSDGNLIEQKEFSKEGDIKKWKIYSYDSNGNNTEEITMDMRGKVEERIVYIYKDDLIVEKKYYDHKDRLVKRKEYKYTYRED